jgi:hypothetical protein
MKPDAILEPHRLIADAIDSAKEIPDPLAGLAEKTTADPSAPFMPETLEALAALKSDRRAAFEALRAQLKKAGCRVTALDDAIAEENGDAGGRAPTQADILIALAQTAELFHAPDTAGFADLEINGHRETWPIRAKGFRRWLARRFFEETGGAPSSEALQSALNVIEAKRISMRRNGRSISALAGSMVGSISTLAMKHGAPWRLTRPAGVSLTIRPFAFVALPA